MSVFGLRFLAQQEQNVDLGKILALHSWPQYKVIDVPSYLYFLCIQNKTIH